MCSYCADFISLIESATALMILHVLLLYLSRSALDSALRYALDSRAGAAVPAAVWGALPLPAPPGRPLRRPPDALLRLLRRVPLLYSACLDPRPDAALTNIGDAYKDPITRFFDLYMHVLQREPRGVLEDGL